LHFPSQIAKIAIINGMDLETISDILTLDGKTSILFSI